MEVCVCINKEKRFYMHCSLLLEPASIWNGARGRGHPSMIHIHASRVPPFPPSEPPSRSHCRTMRLMEMGFPSETAVVQAQSGGRSLPWSTRRRLAVVSG